MVVFKELLHLVRQFWFFVCMCCLGRCEDDPAITELEEFDQKDDCSVIKADNCTQTGYMAQYWKISCCVCTNGT